MNRLSYLRNLIRFAFGANPLLYGSILVSLFSTGVELLAMSALFPLFQVVAGNAPSTDNLISRILLALGVSVHAGTLLWTFIALLALRIATQLAGQSLSLYLSKRVHAQLGSRAFEQIIQILPLREINEKSIGFYMGVAGDESFRAGTLLISMTQFVSVAVLAALYFAAIAMLSTTVAMLVLVFLLVSMLALAGVLQKSHRLGERRAIEGRKVHTIFLDALNNLKSVRAFSVEDYVSGVNRSAMFGYSRILFWIDELALGARLVPVLVLLIVFSGWLAWRGGSIQQAGLALIVTTIVYMMRFFPVMGEAAHLLFKIVSDAKSGQDVTTLLNSQAATPPSHPVSVGRIDAIDFRGVGFAFGPQSRPILSGVSLGMSRGKSYALVGKSGVGKSTLADLLMKFYPPTEGRLELNGVSLTDVVDSEMRKRVILVSQEAAIFDDSVRNNICLGLKASPEEVQAACQVACIHEEIVKMAQGYETRLQYQGKNLSGGQRQRIAIARAIIRRPDVLVLDESTNALDKPTQEVVVENILREYADRIVVFVTHDPHIMGRVSGVFDLERLNASAPARSRGDVDAPQGEILP